MGVVEDDGTISYMEKRGSPVDNKPLKIALADYINQPDKCELIFLSGRKDNQ